MRQSPQSKGVGYRKYRNCLLQTEFTLYKRLIIVWFCVSSWFELHKTGSGAIYLQPQEVCKDEGKLLPPRIRRPRKGIPKQLFLDSDRKRKLAPVGLSSLAMTWVGPSSPEHKKHKPWSSLTHELPIRYCEFIPFGSIIITMCYSSFAYRMTRIFIRVRRCFCASQLSIRRIFTELRMP